MTTGGQLINGGETEYHTCLDCNEVIAWYVINSSTGARARIIVPCERTGCKLPADHAGDHVAHVEVVKNDPINPGHYKGDLVMRIIERFKLSFRIGNVIKYLLRSQEKNGLEDLKKGLWYLEREIADLEGKLTTPLT